MHRLMVLGQRLRSVDDHSRSIHRRLVLSLVIVIAFLTIWVINSPEWARYHQFIPFRISGQESGLVNP